MLSSPATLEYLMFRKGIVLYTKPNLVFDHGRPMYKLDEEFIGKARAALRASKMLLPDGIEMYGNVLFHVHQTYEMSLRAFRAFHLQENYKNHDIRRLRSWGGQLDPEFLSIENFQSKDARRITKYYTDRYRNKASLPSFEVIREQIALAETILHFIEQKMASTPRPTEPTPLVKDEPAL